MICLSLFILIGLLDIVINSFVQLKAKQKHIPTDQFCTNKPIVSRGSIWIGAKGSFCFGQYGQTDLAKGGFLEWWRGVILHWFIQLAKEYIFAPLGLKNTTMIQPNEKGFLTNVALVHNRDGKVIKTGLPITPQVGPSGLWSTPTDLAKIAIEMQNALRNKNNSVVSHNVAKKMTEVSALKNAVGGWGYGWQKTFGYNNYDWFSCNGSNTGVGGSLMATMKDGNGFAFLANGEKPNRIPVMTQTQKTILKLMNWKGDFLSDNVQEIPSDLKAKLIGTYDDFLYQQGIETKIVERNNRLYVESQILDMFRSGKENELLLLKDGSFKLTDYPNLLKFEFSNGKVSTVVLMRDRLANKISMERKGK